MVRAHVERNRYADHIWRPHQSLLIFALFSQQIRLTGFLTLMGGGSNERLVLALVTVFRPSDECGD
jgi:hypothetical protein